MHPNTTRIWWMTPKEKTVKFTDEWGEKGAFMGDGSADENRPGPNLRGGSPLGRERVESAPSIGSGG